MSEVSDRKLTTYGRRRGRILDTVVHEKTKASAEIRYEKKTTKFFSEVGDREYSCAEMKPLKDHLYGILGSLGDIDWTHVIVVAGGGETYRQRERGGIIEPFSEYSRWENLKLEEFSLPYMHGDTLLIEYDEKLWRRLGQLYEALAEMNRRLFSVFQVDGIAELGAGVMGNSLYEIMSMDEDFLLDESDG